METIFSKLLVKLRKDAGFSTAYRFYQDSGGQGVLKVSYRGYLSMEQGRNLPGPERLGIFIWALRLVAKSAEAGSFVAAWLKTMMGESNYTDLVEPLLAARRGGAGLTPMQKAMKKSIGRTPCHLTVAQVETIYASMENYLCYLAMSNDTGAWPLKDFAARLSLKTAAAKKALRALTGVKIVKEDKKDVYSCPIARSLLLFPHLNTLPPSLREKIRTYDAELAATGRRAFRSLAVVRADALEFSDYFPIVEVNVNTADSYAVTEKTANSALFMVEAKVTRLRDF